MIIERKPDISIQIEQFEIDAYEFLKDKIDCIDPKDEADKNNKLQHL